MQQKLLKHNQIILYYPLSPILKMECLKQKTEKNCFPTKIQFYLDYHIKKHHTSSYQIFMIKINFLKIIFS